MKFRLQETFVNAGFLCWLSQVPSVVGPPAVCPLSRSQSLGKKIILDMARENAPFQQHTWGDFAFRLLLRSSSEKICCLMGFGRVDKVRAADCFLCSLSLLGQPLLRLMKGVTGVTQ